MNIFFVLMNRMTIFDKPKNRTAMLITSIVGLIAYLIVAYFIFKNKNNLLKIDNKLQIKKNQANPIANNHADNVFSIEYYPLTDRYYPKYGKYYLATNWYTGIVEKKEDYLFPFAQYGKTKQEAIKLIKLFKEQSLKENVKILPLNDL